MDNTQEKCIKNAIVEVKKLPDERGISGAGGDKYLICYDQYFIVEKLTRLYRIRAARDIPQFGVKLGDYGGWVEKPSNLSQEGHCWIGGCAMVYGGAEVTGYALVTDNAVIKGNSTVTDHVEVSGHAVVECCSHLHGKSKVGGRAVLRFSNLCDYARAEDRATIWNSYLHDNATVSGDSAINNSSLFGHCRISERASIESSEIHDDCQVGSARLIHSIIKGHAKVHDGAALYASKLNGEIYVDEGATVKFSSIMGSCLAIGRKATVSDNRYLMLGPLPEAKYVMFYRTNELSGSAVVGSVMGKTYTNHRQMVRRIAMLTKRPRREIKKLVKAAVAYLK